MPDPVVTALEQAAIPTAITALQAFQQFETDLGTDPTKWPLTYPGAKLKFIGNLSLQVPVLAQAESAALQGAASSQVNSWIATLKAAQTAPTASPA
jgi:hypothetical protein